MQKEQFSCFEKLEAGSCCRMGSAHVEIRTEHTRGLIEKESYTINSLMLWHTGFCDFRDTLNYEKKWWFLY